MSQSQVIYQSTHLLQKTNKKRISSFKKRNFRDSSPDYPERAASENYGTLTLTTNTSNQSMTDNTLTRKDAYGVIIVKGSKQHKVSFLDEISQFNLMEIMPFKEGEISSSKETKIKVKTIKPQEKALNEKLMGRETVYCSKCLII